MAIKEEAYCSKAVHCSAAACYSKALGLRYVEVRHSALVTTGSKLAVEGSIRARAFDALLASIAAPIG